jgi:hypothetical protein
VEVEEEEEEEEEEDDEDEEEEEEHGVQTFLCFHMPLSVWKFFVHSQIYLFIDSVWGFLGFPLFPNISLGFPMRLSKCLRVERCLK